MSGLMLLSVQTVNLNRGLDHGSLGTGRNRPLTISNPATTPQVDQLGIC